MIEPSFYKKIQGWFNFQEVYKKVLESVESGTFVEVGCWLGASTSYMGELIKHNKKDGKFFAVDTWEGSPDEEIHARLIASRGGDIFSIFKENMEAAGIKDIVNPIRKPSVEAAKDFEDESIDFVYIDAGHTYKEVYEDLTSWIPKVKKGGFVGGHDYYPHFIRGNGVKEAVHEFFERDELTIIENSWLIIKE